MNVLYLLILKHYITNSILRITIKNTDFQHGLNLLKDNEKATNRKLFNIKSTTILKSITT